MFSSWHFNYSISFQTDTIHLGCYADYNSDRTLPKYYPGKTNYCSCGLHSLSNNFTVFGLQNGGECWSGVGDYDKHGPTNICVGGKGKANANDVYQIAHV